MNQSTTLLTNVCDVVFSRSVIAGARSNHFTERRNCNKKRPKKINYFCCRMLTHPKIISVLKRKRLQSREQLKIENFLDQSTLPHAHRSLFHFSPQLLFPRAAGSPSHHIHPHYPNISSDSPFSIINLITPRLPLRFSSQPSSQKPSAL